jgi:hypothetical protein
MALTLSTPHGERKAQREFMLEVFGRIVVEDAQFVELTPKAAFGLLFAIDRP